MLKTSLLPFFSYTSKIYLWAELSFVVLKLSNRPNATRIQKMILKHAK